MWYFSLAAFCLWFLPMPAAAEDSSARVEHFQLIMDDPVQDRSIRRRVDLKRVLSGVEDFSVKAVEKDEPRLSVEERDALNRELREIMDSVYDSFSEDGR